MIVDAKIAKKTVLLSSGHILDHEGRSIIGSLRPFEGIYEEDFRNLILSLICLKESLSSELLDRELVYGLWFFCSQIRVWSSSLRKNKIITDHEMKVLVAWGDCVESFCLRSFHPLKLEMCLSHFLEYVASDLCTCPQIYEELLPLIETLKSDADNEHFEIIENAIRAIIV